RLVRIDPWTFHHPPLERLCVHGDSCSQRPFSCFRVAVERFEARPRLASAFAYGRRGSPGGTSDRPSCGLPGSLAAEAEHGAVGNRTEDARTQSGEVLGGGPSVPPSEVRTGTTTDRGRALGRRAARKLRMFREDSPQPGAPRRALPFFRTTALSIWMSRAWSATCCLSR